MGLSIFEMENMTPRQFQNYAEGYLESEQEDFRIQSIRARWISFFAAAGNLKKGTKPEDLLRFEWEGEKGEDPLEDDQDLSPAEQFERSKQHWEKIDQKRGQANR